MQVQLACYCTCLLREQRSWTDLREGLATWTALPVALTEAFFQSATLSQLSMRKESLSSYTYLKTPYTQLAYISQQNLCCRSHDTQETRTHRCTLRGNLLHALCKRQPKYSWGEEERKIYLNEDTPGQDQLAY